MLSQVGVDRVVDMQFGSNEAAYHLIIELYDRVCWDKSIILNYNAMKLHTVVSRVSAHGRLNITRDFGLHGRLPGIKIPYTSV